MCCAVLHAPACVSLDGGVYLAMQSLFKQGLHHTACINEQQASWSFMVFTVHALCCRSRPGYLERGICHLRAVHWQDPVPGQDQQRNAEADHGRQGALPQEDAEEGSLH